MLKDVIFNQKKAFSSRLKLSDQIEPVLRKIKKKEDLQTAILVLKGKRQVLLLFILENHLYAPYRLEENRLTPLLFCEYFKETSKMAGGIDLYQVSPVFFKALLMIAQGAAPSLVATSEFIDVERLLEHITQKKKEAVLVLNKKHHLNLFYFIRGTLCDAYLEEESGEMIKTSGLQEKLLELVFCPDDPDPVQIKLFDETRIQPASDSEKAEEQVFSIESNPAPSEPVSDPSEPVNRADEVSEGNSPALKASVDPSIQKQGADLWVKVLNGSRAGFMIRIASKPVSIGRGQVNVRLNDPQISRFHAELEWAKAGLLVRDHGSTNGLFVNDEKVEEKPLFLDDVIRLGDIHLKVIHGS